MDHCISSAHLGKELRGMLPKSARSLNRGNLWTYPVVVEVYCCGERP